MDMRWLPALAAGALLGTLPTGVGAQIRGSEHAVLAQTVDGTTLTVEYSRPSARGRTLFGDLVAWDRPWTGANWATTFEADRPVRLNGVRVPAGKYSVWWVPRPQQWMLRLDPEPRLFHFQKPDSSAEQIHIPVSPKEAPHVEMLTWSVPAVSGDGATLQMQWGTTAVPLSVVVQPTRPVALSPEQRSVYLAAYDLTIPEGLGWPTAARLEVFEVDGLLRGRLPFPIHEGDELEFDLLPAGEHRFNAGLFRGGTLFNVEMGFAFEFDVADGRAAGLRLRAIEGSVVAEGVRVGG